MKRTNELAEATISEHDGVRYLHLGTPWVQGAMRLKKPNVIELEYVQRMMAWMLLRPVAEATKGHAVQLGLGAATITRFCQGVLKMKTTAVEINPSVIGMVRAYFRLPEDGARLQVVQSDAKEYVERPELAGTADVLCIDLYDHEAASPVLDSAAFYKHCARLLDDGGVMSVNLFGRDASFERSAARIAAAFGREHVVSLQPTREGNTVVLAWKGGPLPPREELTARAQHAETRWGLPARKWVRMIRPLPDPTA
jgi:spermidine synthase